MAKVKSLIVGIYFVPPAKVIIRAIEVGTELILAPELDNPYDPLAIEVMVEPGRINKEELEGLEDELMGYGVEPSGILGFDGPIKLGHVAATGGKPLARSKEPGLGGTLEVHQLAEAVGWENLRAKFEVWGEEWGLSVEEEG